MGSGLRETPASSVERESGRIFVPWTRRERERETETCQWTTTAGTKVL